jgi:c(7)-type cytochrome triheme protein
LRNRLRSWCARFAAPASTFRADRAGVLLALLLLLGGAQPAFAQGQWAPLRKDGLHDPRSPAVKQLQEPREALTKLPPDNTGNMVRWVEALQSGVIVPRPSLKPDVKANILDQDILLDLKGSMPIVLFPHKRHTEWLDCANCHDEVFKKQTGATRITMSLILAGEQCGICHGAVSFPLTECFRCHSVMRPDQTKPTVAPELPRSHALPVPR